MRIMLDPKSRFRSPKGSIFKNEGALDEDYIPGTLLCRDEEILAVSDLFAPLFRTGRPMHGMVFGKTGTGKTVVLRYVLERFDEAVEEYKKNVISIYIQVKNLPQQAIYGMIANKIASDSKPMPKTGLSTYYYIQEIFDRLNALGKSLVLVLDEVDLMRGDDILYQMSRAGSNQMINAGQFVTVIGITNNVRYMEMRDARIISSLSPIPIIFEPYNAEDLKSILTKRVEEAFNPGTLEEAVIPLIAALSAQESGDARRAIRLLQVAGKVAISQDSPVITEGHVKAAMEVIDNDQYMALVDTLPLYSKVTLKALCMAIISGRKGYARTGDVYKIYQSLCQDMDIRCLSRPRISQFITEFETIGLATAKISTGERGGNTRQIILDMDPKKILENLHLR